MSELFTLDENNNLIYQDGLIDEGTLFNLTPEQMEDQLNGLDDTVSQIDLEDPVMEVTGDEITDLESSGSGSVTYNIYAVPSDSTGYPNANSLSYLGDVVRSYPLDFDYVCYRTDSQYAQSMILFIGDNATVTGNRIHFDQVDVIELEYNYESYNNSWLDRNYYQDSDVDITLGSNTLAYTNCIPGYAAFETTSVQKSNYFGLAVALIGAAAFVILLKILGGHKNV